MTKPRLRTVQKVIPPYPLGRFPPEFASRVGLEVIHLLATSDKVSIEGEEWERIFALAINGKWKPSNVGLDDVVLGTFAWGAKSVKSGNPFKTKSVRLISGRNSPKYSFNNSRLDGDPQALGGMVLEIWNGRVESLRNKYSDLRTVILVKGPDLQKFLIFEIETVRYPLDRYRWEWNERQNLVGFDKETGEHRFTWQPHGSQFTIVEKVPAKRLYLQITNPPPKLTQEQILKLIGFHKSWIKVKQV